MILFVLKKPDIDGFQDKRIKFDILPLSLTPAKD